MTAIILIRWRCGAGIRWGTRVSRRIRFSLVLDGRLAWAARSMQNARDQADKFGLTADTDLLMAEFQIGPGGFLADAEQR